MDPFRRLRRANEVAITHVINYDLPTVPTDYVHRVGQTARMEAEGEAATFVTSDEENDLHEIEKALGKPIPQVTHPDFDDRAPPPKVHGYPGGGHRGPPRQQRGRDHRPYGRPHR